MNQDKVKVATDFPGNTNVAVVFPYGPGRGKGEDYREGPNEGEYGDYYNISVEINGVKKGWSIDATLHDALVAAGLGKGSSYYISRLPRGKTYVWGLWIGDKMQEVPRMSPRSPQGAPPAPPAGPPAPTGPQTPPAPTAPPQAATVPAGESKTGRLTVTELAALTAEFLIGAEAAVLVAMDPQRLATMTPDGRQDMVRNLAVSMMIQDQKTGIRRPSDKILGETTTVLKAMLG